MIGCKRASIYIWRLVAIFAEPSRSLSHHSEPFSPCFQRPPG